MHTHSFQRLAALICGLVGSDALAVDATAPGFLLSRYEASERGSRFFTQESLDWRTDGAPSLGVVFDYSHKPLALYRVTSDGQQEVITIVRELAVAHVGGSWTTGAFRVGIDLPVVVYAEGTSGQIGLTTYAAPQRSGVGDLRLSGDWLFTGTGSSAFRAALGVRLNLPTGDAQAYAGDGAFRGSALISLAGTPVSAFVWSARAGVTLKANNFLYAGAQVGHEAFIGAAAGWQTLEGRLLIGPELLASTVLAQAFTNKSTSVEVMLGAHFNVTPSWRIGLAGGRGATTALGSPVARPSRPTSRLTSRRSARPTRRALPKRHACSHSLMQRRRRSRPAIASSPKKTKPVARPTPTTTVTASPMGSTPAPLSAASAMRLRRRTGAPRARWSATSW